MILELFDLSYKHSFVKACHESAKLGLEPKVNPLPLKRKLSKKTGAEDSANLRRLSLFNRI